MNFVGQVINILWHLEGSSEDLTKYQPSSYPYELLNIAVTFFVIMYSVRLRKSSFRNVDHNRVFMSVEPWTHALTSVTSHLWPLGAIALLKIHIKMYSLFVFITEKQKKRADAKFVWKYTCDIPNIVLSLYRTKFYMEPHTCYRLIHMYKKNSIKSI